MAIYSDLASRGVWLSPLCEDLFYSFLRSDQRRWGEVYVQGLVSVPGRKSIRRISDHVMGRPVDQCLQQFINQSPWDWGPVRQRLAQRLVETIRPKAWVLEEVVFPKNGSDSVGVARQFVNSAGRLINCQVGLAVVLVGEDGGCPVNWRLLLPRSWDEDDTRRGRTRLPAHERSRPRWQHLLELIDEMMIDWGLPPAPVVIDARAIQGVEPLIRGLADRGCPTWSASRRTGCPPSRRGCRPARCRTRSGPGCTPFRGAATRSPTRWAATGTTAWSGRPPARDRGRSG